MTCFSRIPSLVTSVLSVFTSSGENIWKVMLKQRNIIGPWGFGKLNWVSPFEKSISLESPKSWWIYIYIFSSWCTQDLKDGILGLYHSVEASEGWMTGQFLSLLSENYGTADYRLEKISVIATVI